MKRNVKHIFVREYLKFFAPVFLKMPEILLYEFKKNNRYPVVLLVCLSVSVRPGFIILYSGREYICQYA